MKNKYKEAIQTEIDTSYLYERVASMQKDDQLRDYYMRLSQIEGYHRDTMYKTILSKDSDFVMPQPSMRARLIAWLGGKFGEGLMISILMDTEKAITRAEILRKQADGITIEGNEGRHVDILRGLTKMTGANLGKIEKRHRSVGGNALRAAVLGANDGLVSNMSLVMGVAGAAPEGNAVVIAGAAGLMAGAISMSLGEWISVKSSQELYEKQIELEVAEIELQPHEEQRELELLYMSKGMANEAAKELAAKIISDPKKAGEILVKEELQIDLDEMEGSPMEAAVASFFLFVVGAIIPLLPFLFYKGNEAIIYSLVASTLGLFLIGGGITLITGKSLWYSGIRQVIFGLAAAGITYGIGRIVGVSLIG